MRMVALLAAAIGIIVEGVVVGAALFVVGGVIGAYSMSLNGADPGHAQVGIRVAAVILGALLVALGAVLLAAALRRRAAGRLGHRTAGRVGPGAAGSLGQRAAGRLGQRTAGRLTMVALVVQCVVVTVAGIALGWEVFAGTLLVLGALLYVQLDESETPPLPRTADTP
ncbi:hypothetical protein AB0J72_47490 [Dactylosporangium sp. NPDC049742]|uniref:hypothetical protein n=1 Tax=Dactylosporangium sp. NPDC049742 TaxID=3154737 RepID=UPI003430ACBB